MSRRKRVLVRRQIPKDTKYGNSLVSKLINYIMRDGEYACAAKIVYGALELIEQKTESEPVGQFLGALTKLGPQKEIKSIRIGGHNIRVPKEITEHRKLILSLAALKRGALSRKESTMMMRLALEIIDINKGEGHALKEKVGKDKDIEANVAFVGYINK